MHIALADNDQQEFEHMNEENLNISVLFQKHFGAF